MKNTEQTVRALLDAEAILASKLLEDSEKYELLNELLISIPQGVMALKVHEVTHRAINRERDKLPKPERRRETQGGQEPAQVAPQGVEETPQEAEGSSEGLQSEEPTETANGPTGVARHTGGYQPKGKKARRP